MIGFAIRHWNGEYPVMRSLLINTLIPDAFLLVAQGWLDSILAWPDPTIGRGLLIATALLWLPLLLWQFTGCFRSASSRVGSSGSALDLYLVFFALVITGVPVLGGVLGMSDRYNRAQKKANFPTKPLAKPYTMTLLNSEVLSFTGEIAFGVTRDLVSTLSKNPDIKTLQLDSDGGVIVEARGMANTVLEMGLTTHVNADCFSACTLVYISGRVRSLGSNARLGFHQYRVDSPYFYPWVDPAGEHDKDQLRFARQNVTPAFLHKMYSHDHESLWIPSHAELARAGVTTRDN